jgi:Bacteriophage lysis protein.
MNKYLIAALAVAVLSLGWAADHYHDKAVSWRTATRQAQASLNRLAATITDMQVRQEHLAELDRKHTEALNAAESQNDNLRRQLAAGTRRMYVQGKCPVPGSDKSSGSGGVGNAATLELSAGAGQNVLDIRAGIISDQQKLNYLQDYIRQQCLK